LIIDRAQDPTETWRFLHRTQVDGHVYELEILYGANSSSLGRLQGLEGQVDGLIVPFAITSKVNFSLARDRHQLATQVVASQAPLPTLVIAMDYEKVERQISDDEGRDFALAVNARYVDWDPTTNEPDAADKLLHLVVRDIMAARRAAGRIPYHEMRSRSGRKSPYFGTDGGDRNRLHKKPRSPLAPVRGGIAKPGDRDSFLYWKQQGSSLHAAPNTRKSRFQKLRRILCFGLFDEPTLYKPMPVAPPRVDMSRDEWVQLYGSFPTVSPTTDSKQ
jgi:hypothetical protein